jgi:hypothetical protein
VKRKITYVLVTWSAPGEGQPHVYIDEIDSERRSIRCIREFSDGSKHAFSSASTGWKDLMPEAPLPLLYEINSDPQFKARNISKKMFEEVWSQTYGLNQFSMMEPLLEVLPEFRPQWTTFVAEWKDNPHNKSKDGLPLYLVLADLAGFLAQLLEKQVTEKFVVVFEVIEHWLLHGDDYVNNAAAAGLLEDLQNPVFYQKRKPDDFRRWMKSATLKSWKRLKYP